MGSGPALQHGALPNALAVVFVPQPLSKTHSRRRRHLDQWMRRVGAAASLAPATHVPLISPVRARFGMAADLSFCAHPWPGGWGRALNHGCSTCSPLVIPPTRC